jgi:hypothetical protein
MQLYCQSRAGHLGLSVAAGDGSSDYAPYRYVNRVTELFCFRNPLPALVDGHAEVPLPSFQQFESLRTWRSRYAGMASACRCHSAPYRQSPTRQRGAGSVRDSYAMA